MIIMMLYFIAFMLLFAVLVKGACMFGHNFIDRGKHISCSQCGLSYVKKLRNKR
jgi:hypothetical protein